MSCLIVKLECAVHRCAVDPRCNDRPGGPKECGYNKLSLYSVQRHLGVLTLSFLFELFFGHLTLISNPKLSSDMQSNVLLLFSRMWCCTIPVYEHLNLEDV
jgi:hypothetical protein